MSETELQGLIYVTPGINVENRAVVLPNIVWVMMQSTFERMSESDPQAALFAEVLKNFKP